MSTSADPQRNLGFLIKDIGRLYGKVFEYEASHIGLSMGQAKVLACVSRHAGASQIQVAELAGIEPMSLVRLLDRMVDDDWIERRPHPTDRRARQLYLTDEGRRMVDRVWKLGGLVRTRALAGFKVEERSALLELLERVHIQLLEMMSEQTGKMQRALEGTGRGAARRSLKHGKSRASARSARSTAARIHRAAR